MSVNLWYKSLLIGWRTRSSAVVLFREKYSGYVTGWPVKKELQHSQLWIQSILWYKQERQKHSEVNHGIPTEPKEIACVKAVEMRNEPTNQDVIKNARSVWWGLYVSVHVHCPDRRGHIQWIQFVLKQGQHSKTSRGKSFFSVSTGVISYSCADMISRNNFEGWHWKFRWNWILSALENIIWVLYFNISNQIILIRTFVETLLLQIKN